MTKLTKKYYKNGMGQIKVKSLINMGFWRIETDTML